jgi:hypothetical protein
VIATAGLGRSDMTYPCVEDLCGAELGKLVGGVARDHPELVCIGVVVEARDRNALARHHVDPQPRTEGLEELRTDQEALITHNP